MRLVDGDSIKRKNPWKDDVLRAVREEETVEAIPISWIIQWAAEHTEYGTLTIEKLLEDWRESQKGE